LLSHLEFRNPVARLSGGLGNYDLVISELVINSSRYARPCVSTGI